MNKIRMLAPTVGNIAVSAVLYFLLRAAGLSELWSLTVPAIASGVITIINTIRAGRLDTVGVIVVLEIVATLALTFATDDPRVAAVRPAFYTLIAGAYFLTTCVRGRTIMYTLATPMATDGGEPIRTAAYEKAWTTVPAFRRASIRMTAIIGAVMLLDSAFRVAVVFARPATELDSTFLLSQAAGVIMLVAVLATIATLIRPQSRIVDGLCERERDTAAA